MQLSSFKFIDPIDLLNIVEYDEPRRIKAIDCEYLVYNTNGFTVVRLNKYYLNDDGQKVFIIPDDVWQRIILAPPVGYGTQLFTSDHLLLPVIVINQVTQYDYEEIFNDGIVSFVTNDDKQVVKELLNWIKTLTAKDFFVFLGQAILKQYADTHVKGGVNEFL